MRFYCIVILVTCYLQKLLNGVFFAILSCSPVQEFWLEFGRKLSRMINEVEQSTLLYIDTISANHLNVLRKVDRLNVLNTEFVAKSSGKVRDVFEIGEILVIITTDRQSAFDRNLAEVPFKGKVLNLLSNWWFEKSAPLVPNSLIACPHPNVTIARKCTVFPVEFVVRGYITGTTATSMWVNYANGVRHYCGHFLPEGLHQHQRLEHVIVTPTTKSTEHDALTSMEEIVTQGWMTQAQWDTCAGHAHTLFALGQQVCADHGLLLVDTKYEFGIEESTGLVRLVDEVHTPDSSRFWVAASYEQRLAVGEVRAM